MERERAAGGFRERAMVISLPNGGTGTLIVEVSECVGLSTP